MKLYRLTFEQFGTEDLIFNGTGAAISPGRWNTFGLKAIYTSADLCTVAAERAFHSLLNHVETYNLQPKTAPKYYYEQICDRNFKLAEVTLNEPSRLIDLTDQQVLSTFLSAAGLPNKTISDYRKSTYVRDPWTRLLAEHLFSQGLLGFKALSARSDSAPNVILFEDHLKNEDWVLDNIHDLKISAVSLKKEKLKLNQKACDDTFWYESHFEEALTKVLMV